MGAVTPYVSRQAKTEKARIASIIFEAAVRVSWKPPKWFTSKIIIWNGLQDLDNSLKVALDGMKGKAFIDDRYHLHTDTSKRWDDGAPRIEVTITEANPCDYGRPPDGRTRARASDAPKLVTRRLSDGRAVVLPPMVARVLDRSRAVPRLPQSPPPG